jgi:hypothetical protein
VPDLPLAAAQEGTVFKLSNGTGSGSMAWLVWNNGITPSSGTLANSLTVPGDSTDYTNAGIGSVTPLYPFMVRGYVNPFDTVDLIMQSGDWVTVSTGSVNSAEVRNQINGHSLNGRELPLIVWDSLQAQGGNTYVRTVQFAIFRLHGHNLTQGGGGPSWLLVEFVRWETEICTEGHYPIAQVNLNGPTTGITNVDYDFTATVAPTMTNQPITYTWQATGHTPFTQTAGITDTINLNWSTPGAKVITVTAENLYRVVTAVHTITLTTPPPLLNVTITGPVTGTANVDYAFTAAVVPTTTNQPITYTWQVTDQTDITHTSGITDTAVFQWPISGPKIITVTAGNGLSTVTATHLITISQPVLVPIMGITLTGPITGLVDMDYGFTAVITPTTATQPITYTWQATGQNPITHTGSLSDVVTFSWHVTGPQIITVTAANGLNEPVTAVHTITIEAIDDWLLYLPFLIKP